MAIGNESEQSGIKRRENIRDFERFMDDLNTFIYNYDGDKFIGRTLSYGSVSSGNGFTNIYVQVGRSLDDDTGQYEFCLRVTADGFYPQFDPSVVKKLIELHSTLKFEVSYRTMADLEPFLKKLAAIAAHTRKINYEDHELTSSDKSLDRAILILKNMKSQDVKDEKEPNEHKGEKKLKNEHDDDQSNLETKEHKKKEQPKKR